MLIFSTYKQGTSLDEIKDSADKVLSGISKPRKKRAGRFMCDGEYFDSLPELALWKYAKDHNEEIEHEPSILFYFLYDKLHKYFPDFIYKGKYIEIKGNHLVDNAGNLVPFYSDKPIMFDICQAKTILMSINSVEVWTQEVYNKYVDWLKSNYNVDDFRTTKIKKVYEPNPQIDKSIQQLTEKVKAELLKIVTEGDNYPEIDQNEFYKLLPFDFNKSPLKTWSCEKVKKIPDIVEYYKDSNVKDTCRQFGISYKALKHCCLLMEFEKSSEELKETYKNTRIKKYGSKDNWDAAKEKIKIENLKNVYGDSYELYLWAEEQNKKKLGKDKYERSYSNGALTIKELEKILKESNNDNTKERR